MRVTGIPNKYEILQQYYLEENGEQITYTEAMTRYYELSGEEKEDFVKYYNDFFKEYYGNDDVEYEPLDENGYNWRNAPSGEYSTLRKNDLRIKYSIEGYAKEKGITLDPQWAGYSAEEIIQMENNGVNIPQDVLDIAHSIYESTGTNYTGDETDSGNDEIAEKEPFLELVPKAAKKIEKCEETNEKISDAIDELLPEKNRRERTFKDKMEEQKKSLQEYEDFIKEWNKIQTKINNGEALSDKEAQRYAELTGMFEEKKSSDDDTFSIDKQEIAKSLNEINIYVTLGEELADETLEIGDTLADYTSKTNYKTTAQSVSKEIGFIRTIVTMAKGKNLAEEADKIGNETKEYTSETKSSVNDIATVLDIKDQLVTPEELNLPENENGKGAVQETNPESITAKNETKTQGVTEQEDFEITDDSVKGLIKDAADINGDLLSQSVYAVKSIKVAKNDKKFAYLANIKVTRLVKAFKEEEAKRQQEIEKYEEENKQLKKEISSITGESEDQIDENINSGKDDPQKYNGMEESDKNTVEANKQKIASNNQAIANTQQEGETSKQEFTTNTAKEKNKLDKAIPDEEEKIADNTEQKEEIIPQAKEDLDFTKNSGITLTKIGTYRVKVGLSQIASFQFSKGMLNIAKGTISIGIGFAARIIANTPLAKLAEKTTNSAVGDGNDALKSLNTVNNQIVEITGEDTPQGVSQGDEEKKQEEENNKKSDNKPVTNETNSSESPEETTAKTGAQADTTVKETTAAISMQEPSNSTPIPTSPVKNAGNASDMAALTKEKNITRNSAPAVTVNNNSSNSNKGDEVPEVNKNNAKSQAADANKNLSSIKSQTAKDQKETEEITKDEEKSEKQLEKEAKNLQKKITKESKEMEKLQKETEQIQKQQLQILQEFEELTVQNEQLTAEAQTAAANQPTQPADNQNQAGGLLVSTGFNAGQAQNATVNEKISSIETNNQRINQLGIQFTANDKIVQRNQSKITASQKFIKTSNKKFQKVTKTKEKKANERLKAEEAKQKALQKKIGLVGIFEKVFQVVTSIGALLSVIPFTAALGALLTKIGLAGTLFCATVKTGILAANGMIDQAFITLGMSIATAALTMVGTGAAASSGLQIATASLNVVSSAASLGASVQQFQGKDAGILGSIATIAGAASAVTGAIGAFGSLGKTAEGVAKSSLSKFSTIAMQSGSLISNTSQVISQVRQWQGKEGDTALTNIMGMVGMGLTLVGTAGNIASSIQESKAAKKVSETEKTESKEQGGDDTDTDKKEEIKKGEQTTTQNTDTSEVTTTTDNTTTDTTTESTEIQTEQTDVQKQQAEELKQAATQDSSESTDEVIQEINQTTENNKTDNETLQDTKPESEAELRSEAEAQAEEEIKAEAQNETDTENNDTTEAQNDNKDNKTDGDRKISKFEKFMEKADPYMELIGTAGQLASSIMTYNDETDDNTKRKVIPAWEFDRRTQEIMKKRRKRQAALKRYFA